MPWLNNLKFGCLVLALSLVPVSFVSASSISCSDTSSCKTALNNLQYKFTQGQKKIHSSQKVADQYHQALQGLSVKLDTTAQQIDQTQGKIGNTNDQIKDLTQKINDENTQIQDLRLQIKDEIVTMYEMSQTSTVEIILSSQTLSEANANIDNLQTIQSDIQQKIDDIKQIEADLQQQKDSLQQKKDSLATLNDKLTSHKKDLSVQTGQTNFLLNATRAQIQNYAANQSVIEQQIAQVQKRLASLISEAHWGNDIVSNSPANWMYNQLNYSETLGNSPYTVHDYGCLVTSMAMVATYYGHHVTPPQIANNTSYFDGGGYARVGAVASGIGLSISDSGPVDWSVVDQELAKNHPVIISIYLPRVGAINSDGSSHFIVLQAKTGNKYLMQDPLGSDRSYALKYVRSMYILRSN